MVTADYTIFEKNELYGRIKIFTDEQEITKDNVMQVFGMAYLDHLRNAVREQELNDYRKGKHSTILNREKKIRNDIDVKLIDGFPNQIVNTHLGYNLGNPIIFIQKDKVEEDERKPKLTDKEEDIRLAMLNKMCSEQGKSQSDIQLGKDMLSMGVGYQMAWLNPNKMQYAPFRIATLNPRTTFVVYRNDPFRDAMLGVTYVRHEDGTLTITMYTPTQCYTIGGYNTETKTYTKRLTETPNVLGVIPIVEFEMTDRMAIFESVIPIIDAIDILNSDRVNDVCQHVQSLLWLHNCQVDSEQKERLVDGDGVIATKSNGDGKDAKIEYLSQTLNQSEIQSYVDHLNRRIEEITATPSWQEASGGSTTGAMQLSNGWQSLEISAKTFEQQFKSAEMKLLDVIVAIINSDSRKVADLSGLNLSDIEPHFSRNKHYDLVSKVNSLATLIQNGVDGLTAFATVDLFPDTQQAWVDSQKTIEGIQKKLVQKEEKAKNPNTEMPPNANAMKDEQGNGGENNENKEKVEESEQPSQQAQVEDS